MTETHHHNGQNPTPTIGLIACLLVTAYATITLTPEQLAHLGTAIAIPGGILTLTTATRKT